MVITHFDQTAQTVFLTSRPRLKMLLLIKLGLNTVIVMLRPRRQTYCEP